MEVLSEVLKAVKLDGALFYNAEFSAPWCAQSIDARTVTSYLSPNSQHVIIFHLLTEGRGYALVEGDDRSLPLNAGDILIVPHGDAHILGNGGRSWRWTAHKCWNKCCLKVLKFPAWVEGGTHQICLRLHVLRFTAGPGFPWRVATHVEGQYSRRRIRPMAGTVHPLFGGSCGYVQAR